MSKTRIYAGSVMTVLLFATVFGLLLPNLVSSQNDMSFLSAIIIAIAYFPAAFYILDWMWRSPKPTNAPKDSKNHGTDNCQ